MSSSFDKYKEFKISFYNPSPQLNEVEERGRELVTAPAVDEKDSWKIDAEIEKAMSEYKLRGSAKSTLAGICKVMGLLPHEVHNIFEQAFYKFLGDENLSYMNYSKFKRFIDAYGKDSPRRIKNFLVTKNDSINAAFFTDNSPASGDKGSMLIVSKGLIEKVPEDEIKYVMIAQEIAKGIMEHKSIIDGINTFFSLVLSIVGQAILDKLLKMEGPQITTPEIDKDFLETTRESRPKEDSGINETMYSSYKKDYEKMNPSLFDKREPNAYFFSKPYDTRNEKPNIQMAKKYAPLLLKFPKGDIRRILIREFGVALGLSIILKPILNWLFSSAFGFEKEADKIGRAHV